MKILIKELEPVTSIDYQLDLNDYVQNVVDLVSIEDCRVQGKIYKEIDSVRLDLKIDAKITQKCAITLKPVPYNLSFETEIIYSNDKDNMDYALEDEIHLSDIVFAEILVEKEVNVYHETANPDLFKDDREKGHPAFEALKDLMKKN